MRDTETAARQQISTGSSLPANPKEQEGQSAALSAPVTPEGRNGGMTPSIGQMVTAELEELTARERQLREFKALASCRVLDLKPDQLGRVYETMLLLSNQKK